MLQRPILAEVTVPLVDVHNLTEKSTGRKHKLQYNIIIIIIKCCRRAYSHTLQQNVSNQGQRRLLLNYHPCPL
jgi:hypothetical protein